MASEVDLQPLLAEIARRTTRLLDCDFCAVSTYDPATRLVQALAEYDGGGERLPDTETYDVRQFHLTRKVLAEHVAAVVNVDDPRADAAEVAALRSGGDRSLLMMPLVYRGESIGLLEAIDARRARSYTRQELRLCQAVAGQAAVALHNTSLRAASRSGRDELRGLCAALRDLAPALAAALAEPDRDVALDRLANAVCDVLGAVSCVIVAPHRTAGAARPATGGSVGHLVVGRDPGAPLSITVTLPKPPSEGLAELLDLLATVAAAAIEPGRRPAAPGPARLAGQPAS